LVVDALRNDPRIGRMSTKTKSKAEPTLDVAPAPVTTTDATIATLPKAVAVGLEVATTVVTSTLDSLEEVRLTVRSLATAGLDYAETVGRSVSATTRNIVARLDVAADSVIAGARKIALEAIESRRSVAAAVDVSPAVETAVAA
jgi:hypothetical protein